MAKETGMKPMIQYFLLFTVLISLFSLQQLVPQIYLMYYYWIIAFTVILFGLTMAMLNLNEVTYEWNGLKNKKSFSNWLILVVYFFNSLVGFIVISLGVYFLLVLSGVISAPII